MQQNSMRKETKMWKGIKGKQDKREFVEHLVDQAANAGTKDDIKSLYTSQDY